MDKTLLPTWKYADASVRTATMVGSSPASTSDIVKMYVDSSASTVAFSFAMRETYERTSGPRRAV